MNRDALRRWAAYGATLVAAWLSMATPQAPYCNHGETRTLETRLVLDPAKTTDSSFHVLVTGSSQCTGIRLDERFEWVSCEPPEEAALGGLDGDLSDAFDSGGSPNLFTPCSSGDSHASSGYVYVATPQEICLRLVDSSEAVPVIAQLEWCEAKNPGKGNEDGLVSQAWVRLEQLEP